MAVFYTDSPHGIKGIVGVEPGSSLLICANLSLYGNNLMHYLLNFFLHVLCVCKAAFVDSLMFQSENMILPQQPIHACFLSRPKSLNPPKNREFQSTYPAPWFIWRISKKKYSR